MVSSLTRKARATTGVGSEQTVRSVSATCASSDSAGWQQVKMSRSMSSSPKAVSQASSGMAAASISARVFSASALARKAIRRRSISMAFRRPAVTSQARGLAGISFRQATAADAQASCNPSSARSKSPTSRISVASASGACRRKASSIAGLTPPAPSTLPRCEAARPNLDRAECAE